jgi:hypothetical protein
MRRKCQSSVIGTQKKKESEKTTSGVERAKTKDEGKGKGKGGKSEWERKKIMRPQRQQQLAPGNEHGTTAAPAELKRARGQSARDTPSLLRAELELTWDRRPSGRICTLHFSPPLHSGASHHDQRPTMKEKALHPAAVPERGQTIDGRARRIHRTKAPPSEPKSLKVRIDRQ